MVKYIFWSIIIIVIISLILIDYLDLVRSKKIEWDYTDFYNGKNYICFDKTSGYIYYDGEEK
ncbi:hypothetical protein SAMN02745163_03191 [Clostridium cavendishii DSM 21758]|uniref:Uncharacterized protein n=1 Tax=Clostridium cavendishii DSM 21758 TaxID=1121302 RepID=A0A1M6PLH4_9CLOT|nr:hypothetical protein [Clostridium cavendishii]SHK08743.1 hypothetical protein SAMN02745163_03191 [Clostridium cavendishii DSM 21758]